jgi:nicotinate-nucleotide adenylyltransferase
MDAKVGIYAGTFDPVHAGHVAFALAALRDCGLDEVVFLPERSPRHKQNVAHVARRVEALETATASLRGLRVVELPTEQFTVRGTLPELRSMFPNAELTVLVGSDVVRRSLPHWPDLAALLHEVSLAVGLRGVDTQGDVAGVMNLLAATHDTPVRYGCVRTRHAHVASTHIRNAL